MPFLRTAAHIFCFLWSRPCNNHAICCTDGKTIQCKSMLKSKNRHFYYIFVSLGDAPGATTLNVAWIEREFDAYKLPRCMCPSNYNRF